METFFSQVLAIKSPKRSQNTGRKNDVCEEIATKYKKVDYSTFHATMLQILKDVHSYLYYIIFLPHDNNYDYNYDLSGHSHVLLLKLQYCQFKAKN